MTEIVAAAGPSAYWYLARGTGVVALLLLTASVVLGVLGSLRFAAAPRWPRFAIDTLHRDVSLLVIVLLAAHIVMSVLDSFAPIRLIDAVIPFASSYRPLWLGFGALSFDILLALTITSLIRRRLGHRTWRAIHWLAYASWPVALLHGLGTGTDTKVWWMLSLTLACIAAVLAAMCTRVCRSKPDREGIRVGALALAVLAPLGIAIFTVAGPLQLGWAQRAGTPVSLLAKAHRPTAAAVAVRSPGASADTRSGPFSARLAGTVSQTPKPGGAVVDLALRLSGGASGRLRIRLAGTPIDGGGLSLTGSQVDLKATGLASVMQGKIVSLEGQRLLARVTSSGGSALDLRAQLNIDSQARSVSGTLSASPASPASPAGSGR